MFCRHFPGLHSYHVLRSRQYMWCQLAQIHPWASDDTPVQSRTEWDGNQRKFLLALFPWHIFSFADRVLGRHSPRQSMQILNFSTFFHESWWRLRAWSWSFMPLEKGDGATPVQDLYKGKYSLQCHMLWVIFLWTRWSARYLQSFLRLIANIGSNNSSIVSTHFWPQATSDDLINDTHSILPPAQFPIQVHKSIVGHNIGLTSFTLQINLRLVLGGWEGGLHTQSQVDPKIWPVTSWPIYLWG